MAPSKIRKAIWAIKDRTSISLARVAGSTSFSNLEVAILKATRHDENPPNQRYVAEILSLTSYSRALVNACVTIIGQRLNKTKNWVVALKTLILIQRLLSQGTQVLEKEIFYATRKGTKFLNMCDFRDSSSKSCGWDYTAFIRAYALYLDEQLEFRMQGYRGRSGGFTHRGEEGNAMVAKGTHVYEMSDDAVLSRINHLMLVLDRFLACRPAGAAKHNRVVMVALFPIVKESIELFHNITEVLGILIDRFMQLDIPDMVKVYEIFQRISKQFDELEPFYDWTKTIGILRFSDYPDVMKIPQSKLDMMDDFIRQKTAMLQNRKKVNSTVSRPTPVKALPLPEGNNGEVKETKEEDSKTQQVGDLLNLSGDAAGTEEEHGDTYALALINSGLTTTAPTSTSASSGDWEMALVESVSQLSNQKPSLPNGLDTFILDNMYQQGAIPHQVIVSSSGSASSVAVGLGRGPQMLALPAPQPLNGGFSTNYDPFAASLAIAPPPYVQMSEIEKKHQLLVEEQLMWQQYARDGMQGQVGLAKVQQQNSYQYITGGYTQTW